MEESPVEVFVVSEALDMGSLVFVLDLLDSEGKRGREGLALTIKDCASSGPPALFICFSWAS